MRTITYLEDRKDSVLVSILKKGIIEHEYLLIKGSPSFLRLAKIVEHYVTKNAYIKLYPNIIFSIILDGNPYG